jgi:DNA-directed RNA polymerase specialized sigma subunit
MEAMNSPPDYTRNDELFSAFRGLQAELSGRLATNPGVVRAWLDELPRLDAVETETEPARTPASWRTARLSAARRRDLAALVKRAGEQPAESGPLARWLLSAVPVCTYLEIAGSARPSLREVDPLADDFCRQVVSLRETIFLANYGLAKVAARSHNSRDHSDLLSAASCGLLDAVDRYVPGATAARFSYFARYWIRYHLSRHIQKNSSVVSFPIHQHRIGRRIERYLASQNDGSQPAAAKLCADLAIGADALQTYRLKPKVVSLHSPVGDRQEAPEVEYFLSDPAPSPDAVLEDAETAVHLRALLRTSAQPATGVMLAYARSVGALADAAEDYLSSLQDLTLERIRRRA